MNKTLYNIPRGQVPSKHFFSKGWGLGYVFVEGGAIWPVQACHRRRAHHIQGPHSDRALYTTSSTLKNLSWHVCRRAFNCWSWVPVVAPHVGGVLGALIYTAGVGAHLRHHGQPVSAVTSSHSRQRRCSNSDSATNPNDDIWRWILLRRTVLLYLQVKHNKYTNYEIIQFRCYFYFTLHD